MQASLEQAVIMAALLLTAGPCLAQTTTNLVAAEATNRPPAVVNEPAGKAWSFSAQVYGYIVPESQDYVQPTLTADHGWLHLEARYNYENLKTGSTWLGYNVKTGDKLTFQGTAMLGGVFGNTTGIAPGWEFTLDYWKLELSSQGEYVFDTRNSEGDFFYTWSELSLAPTEWLRFGLAVQRTKAYHTDRDIQRGLLVGLSYKTVSFTTYVFNPDESRPTVVLSAIVNF